MRVADGYGGSRCVIDGSGSEGDSVLRELQCWEDTNPTAGQLVGPGGGGIMMVGKGGVLDATGMISSKNFSSEI